MATYLIVNVIFLAVVLAVFKAFNAKFSMSSKPWWISLGCLLLLTAIFDSLIIGFGMVAYNPDKILGLFVGLAPIEDFFYAVAAIIIIPTIWRLLDKKI